MSRFITGVTKTEIVHMVEMRMKNKDRRYKEEEEKMIKIMGLQRI